MNEQELHNMKLHEIKTIVGKENFAMEVMRTVGGWIYSNIYYTYRGNDVFATTVFVPEKKPSLQEAIYKLNKEDE